MGARRASISGKAHRARCAAAWFEGISQGMHVEQPRPEWLSRDFFLTGKDLWLLELQSLDDWPYELELPSRRFGLFLALDAHRVRDGVIRKVASRCLEEGLAYACVWGPDCGRVGELFEIVFEEASLPGSAAPTATVSSREGESLDEALWYFINSAYPDTRFGDCRTWLSVVVEAPTWVEEIRRRLLDPEKLSNDLMRRI